MAQATAVTQLTAKTADLTVNLSTPTGITGALIVINVTVDPGTASVTPTIRIRDEDGNYDEVYWTATAAIAAVGDFSYIFYPGVTAADVDITEEISAPIPAEWQMFMNAADTESLTYSIRCQWIP